MEGDTHQSMQPVTADTYQSMSPVTVDSNQSMQSVNFLKCHLWLPSWGYGGKLQSAWPPGKLRGRGLCRQAGGWRGTQTYEQKDGQLCESSGYFISYSGHSSYGMQPFKMIFTYFAYFKRISRFFDRCLPTSSEFHVSLIDTYFKRISSFFNKNKRQKLGSAQR